MKRPPAISFSGKIFKIFLSHCSNMRAGFMPWVSVIYCVNHLVKYGREDAFPKFDYCDVVFAVTLL